MRSPSYTPGRHADAIPFRPGRTAAGGIASCVS
jgi:hypothetical protein